MSSFGVSTVSATLTCLLTIFINIQMVKAVQCSYYSYGRTRYFSCYSYQRCCGSRCCDTTYTYSIYDLWYFWFCLILFIFLCSLASGIYYRKRHRRMQIQVAQNNPPNITMVATTGASGQPPYPPPPTYNQLMHHQHGPPIVGVASPYPPVGYGVPPPSYQTATQSVAFQR